MPRPEGGSSHPTRRVTSGPSPVPRARLRRAPTRRSEDTGSAVKAGGSKDGASDLDVDEADDADDEKKSAKKAKKEKKEKKEKVRPTPSLDHESRRAARSAPRRPTPSTRASPCSSTATGSSLILIPLRPMLSINLLFRMAS